MTRKLKLPVLEASRIRYKAIGSEKTNKPPKPALPKPASTDTPPAPPTPQQEEDTPPEKPQLRTPKANRPPSEPKSQLAQKRRGTSEVDAQKRDQGTDRDKATPVKAPEPPQEPSEPPPQPKTPPKEPAKPDRAPGPQEAPRTDARTAETPDTAPRQPPPVEQPDVESPTPDSPTTKEGTVSKEERQQQVPEEVDTVNLQDEQDALQSQELQRRQAIKDDMASRTVEYPEEAISHLKLTAPTAEVDPKKVEGVRQLAADVSSNPAMVEIGAEFAQNVDTIPQLAEWLSRSGEITPNEVVAANQLASAIRDYPYLQAVLSSGATVADIPNILAEHQRKADQQKTLPVTDKEAFIAAITQPAMDGVGTVPFVYNVPFVDDEDLQFRPSEGETTFARADDGLILAKGTVQNLQRQPGGWSYDVVFTPTNVAINLQRYPDLMTPVDYRTEAEQTAFKEGFENWQKESERKGPFTPLYRQRKAPADNYLVPLSNHAPTMYRETSPERAVELLPFSNMGTGGLAIQEYYMADVPDLALGQGLNKGVLLSFDASKIKGTINRQMPGWKFGYENGIAEYIAKHNDPRTLQEAVTGLRIPYDTRMTKTEAAVLKRITDQMVAAGWKKYEEAGYVEYVKPGSEDDQSQENKSTVERQAFDEGRRRGRLLTPTPGMLYAPEVMDAYKYGYEGTDENDPLVQVAINSSPEAQRMYRVGKDDALRFQLPHTSVPEMTTATADEKRQVWKDTVAPKAVLIISEVMFDYFGVGADRTIADPLMDKVLAAWERKPASADPQESFNETVADVVKEAFPAAQHGFRSLVKLGLSEGDLLELAQKDPTVAALKKQYDDGETTATETLIADTPDLLDIVADLRDGDVPFYADQSTLTSARELIARLDQYEALSDAEKQAPENADLRALAINYEQNTKKDELFRTAVPQMGGEPIEGDRLGREIHTGGGEGSRSNLSQPSETSGPLERTVSGPDYQKRNRIRQDVRQSSDQKTSRRIPAEITVVNKRIDRLGNLFQSKGLPKVAEWLTAFKDHINKIGVDDALETLGEVQNKNRKVVQLSSSADDWRKSPISEEWMDAYFKRIGIIPLMTTPVDPTLPIVSTTTSADPWEGRPLGSEDFHPLDTPYNDKLEEAKDLPGLETSEDLNVIMGRPVSHITDDVMAVLDDRYGKDEWLIKSYDPETAYAGHGGTHFPQRIRQVIQNAKRVMKEATENLAALGYSPHRDDKNFVTGIADSTGEVFPFGSEAYDRIATASEDVEYWGNLAQMAGASEWGPALPPGGGRFFMAQPAFPIAGMAEEERAKGKVWGDDEARVHVVVQNGKAKAIPYAVKVKGHEFPIIFETEDSKAMVKSAEDTVNALPEKARNGQLYGVDLVKTTDGFNYRAVELNAAVEYGTSGWLGFDPLVMDAYVSYLTGQVPAHVSFIHDMLTRRQGQEPPDDVYPSLAAKAIRNAKLSADAQSLFSSSPASAPIPKGTPPTTPQADAVRGFLMREITEGIDNTPGINNEQRQIYLEGMKRALRDMPEGALKQVHLNLRQVSWRSNTAEITQEFWKRNGGKTESTVRKDDTISGFCDKGEMVVDGKDKQERLKGETGANIPTAYKIYAHEIGHIIDRDMIYSSSKKWIQIWIKEIVGDINKTAPLSEYARAKYHRDVTIDSNGKYVLSNKYAANEGFAEFCRMLYGSDVDKDKARKRFPHAFKFFEDHGLWGNQATTFTPAPSKLEFGDQSPHPMIVENVSKEQLPEDIQVTRDDDSKVQAKFNAGGDDYLFDAENYNGIWWIDFAKTNVDKKWKQHQLGGGDLKKGAEVFVKVGSLLANIIHYKTPEKIVFTANNYEESRVRLYDRFAKIIAKESGYKLAREQGKLTTRYILTNEKPNVANLDFGDEKSLTLNRKDRFQWLSKSNSSPTFSTLAARRKTASITMAGPTTRSRLTRKT